MPAEFLSGAREAARALAGGIEDGDLAASQAAIRRARAAQQVLAHASGVAIETDALRGLIEISEAHGYAAKASGAGGGDCGVALGSGADSARGEALAAAWADRGILPLDLRVTGPCRLDQTEEVT